MIRKSVLATLLLLALQLDTSGGNLRAEGDLAWIVRLYNPGKGYWKRRIRVDVENPADRKIEGDSISLVVGTEEGMVNLAGHEVKSLRVCDAQGEELLYELLDGQGKPKHEGKFAAGDLIAFAVECEKGARASYYIYFDNADAGPVDEFWRANLPIVNGGFEEGAAQPEGWDTWDGDEAHRLAWVEESPHSGRRCAKVEVDKGAEPTWVKYLQTNIPLLTGKEYVLRGWVRAKDAEGPVGFFIHINGDKPQIMNQLLDAGQGTYDWKEVEFRFTVPLDAKNATVGTLLRGAGTAWYDDVRLDRLDKEQPVKVSAAGEESVLLSSVPFADKWLQGDAPDGPQWEHRLTVTLLNFSDKPAREILASADLVAGLKSVFRKVNLNSIRVVDPSTGTVIPHLLTDNALLFLAEVPARSEKAYHIYLSSDAGIPAGAGLTYADLVSSPANMVKNPSFEEGESEWEFPEERASSAPRGNGGAHSGEKCAKLEIPPDAKPSWQGRRQTIEVEPNTTYFYSGFLKTKGVDGSVTLHLHQHNENHEQIKGQWGLSTRPTVSGDSDWTQTGIVFRTSGETRFVSLHLTMNCHGTLWHDDIIFCPMIPSIVGTLESRTRKDVAAGQPKDLAVWLVNPAVKVFREDMPEQLPKRIELGVARNEYEPVQMALRSARDISDVRVKIEPPIHANGDKLADFRVDLVGYVPIDYPSSYYRSNQPAWYRLYPKAPPRSDGWAGDWPDPLVPYKPFDLVANQSQPVWITFYAPDSAVAGEYEGKVIIQVGEAPIVEIPLHVNIWDFALPKDTHLRVIYDLRFRAMGNLYSDPESLRSWYKSMGEHRVCSDRFRPEVKISYKDGQVELEAKEFDEIAHYCLDELRMNSFYTPHLFYTFGWAYPPKKLFGFEAFTPEYKEALQKCLKAYMDHLRQKGWDRKALCYVSDEPHFGRQYVVDNLATYCKLVHEVEPELRTYSSTWRYVPGYVGAVTAWGVGEYGCFPVEKMEERLKAGDMLIFTTDGQMCIDTPYCGIERMLPYFCWKYHVVGYEFWGISWWTYDPWEKGYHQYISQASAPDEPRFFVRYPSGDGYLMYPGERVGVKGPISSIRLEQAREGIEDYEYFVLLKDKIAEARAKGIPTAEAEAALARVNDLVTIPNKGGMVSTDIMPDPDAPLAARLAIGRQIERLCKELQGK